MIIMDMHLHSSYSDGKNTLEEMVLASIESGFTHIAFTDHVWRNSTWLEDYLKEIEELKDKYLNKIKIYSGVEAKVIDQNGNIDLNPNYYDKIDEILASFHRIPLGNDRYIKGSEIHNNLQLAIRAWYNAFMNILRNPVVYAVAHPFAIFKENNIPINQQVIKKIIKEAALNNKLLEVNIKRDIPDKFFLNLISNYNTKIIIGSDSHSVDDVLKYKNEVIFWNNFFYN